MSLNFDYILTYNYYLFNGNVDMRKGVFRLREVVRSTMGQNPDDSHNVFIFMSKSRKIVKLLHYERGFYVLYEKRPLMGKFRPIGHFAGCNTPQSPINAVVLRDSNV